MKNLNKKVKFLGLSIALTGLLSGPGAQAAPLNGGFDFGGISHIQNSGGVDLTKDLSTASQLTNFSGSTITSGTEFGSFSGLGGTNLSWVSPFVLGSIPPHVAFTFLKGLDTVKLTLNSWTYSVNSTTLSVIATGTGILTDGNPLDIRKANFTFTSQTTPDTKSVNHSFSGSISSVPIPAASLFVAPALLGLFGAFKRKEEEVS